MRKNIFAKSLFAIRTLIVVLCVICGAVPAWAHGTHYARVTVTASPTANGKVYMTTDVDKVPASGDWNTTMSEDWNCKDGIGPSEDDNRTYYVHALAESGYHFEKWSSNSSGTDSKSTEAKYAYSTKASSTSSGSPTPNSIYAIFAVNPTYTATFLTTENGTYTYQYGSSEAVTVAAEQSVTTNLNFALTATPDAGYELYGWYTESGGVKTYFDYSSYSLPSYALPGDVRIGVDFMPIGTPLFQIKGAAAVYSDLNAAVTACGGATKTIVLINNGTLPAGDYTIPANVTLLIPFDAAYTCYTATPALTSNTWIAPTAYRTLTMSPGAHLTVNGKISVSAKLSSKSFHGPCGAPSGTYGAIQMLSEGETKSTITLNNGAKLYSWGYIYGEGKVDALSGSTVYEGFTLMDWRGGQHTLNIYNARNTYKVFPFNQYYIQNIEVPLTMHKGATESVYSSIYGDGNDYDLSITIVGESAGLFRLTGTGATLTKWYDPQADRQHFEMVGQAQISAISFSIMGQTMSSSAFVLPINNNMDITVKNGATVAISEDVCIMPDASITVEQGATMNIASGKNVYIYDKNAYTNAGSYSTSRGGYPSVGPGRYGGADYIQRMKYSPSWATTPSRELRRLQNMGSARFQINGTLNVNGKLYTTEGGADIHSNTDGAAVILAGGAGTAQYTYQVDCEDVDPGQTKVDYYYSIPITSAQLHNADASYVETAGSAASTTWTYANGHWGWCIVWRLEDGTELKRLYHYTQPDEAWLASNAPTTDRAPEGTCSYVFNGWNQSTHAASQEIEMVADYTKTCAEYYTVTWKSEDGTETLETDENVGQGEATRFNGEAPAKAIDPVLSKVYTFDGWSIAPNGEKVYGIEATPPATDNATYYAHFAVTDVAAVVIANGENTYCTTIEEAFEVANSADYTPTIQVWKNTSATGTLTYTGKNHCTLDLNGHTLSGTAQPLLTINNEGFTVTITDRSSAQEGKLHLSWSSTGNVYVVQITSGVLCLEAGTIHGQNTGSGATAGVYANNRQEVIMTGGKIQMETAGTCYGIFAQGKATVSGGTIQVESSTKSAYAIQAYGANGNAIINDGYFSADGVKTVTCLDAASNASAVVQGGYFSTNANLETYKAATCRVYSLPSTKLPYRYTVAEKTPLVASVTINSVTTEYSSFADAWTAVNSASAASTLKLLEDVDVTTQLTYDNTNSQNCTLDLNGYTLTSTAGVNAPFTINHSGINFTITDGTESKSGKLSMTGTFSNTFFGVYVQDGNLVLDAGTIEAKIGGNSNAVGAVTVNNKNAPSFTMNGGTIYVKTTNNRKGRGVYANKTATINNGTILIDAAGEGVGVQRDAGTVNISNGRFHISGSSASVTNQANNTFVKIYGGYYNINTNLSTACAANHHVLPNDDATYLYKVAEAYNLTWITDGELSGEGYTPSGLTEVGTTLVAPTPIKAGYTFYGWTPEVAAAMPSADTEYTAQWAVASVTIGETTTLYTDFSSAWSAANSATAAATLTLLQDVTGLSSSKTYNASHDLTLDLNGHTMSGTSAETSLLQVGCAGYMFILTDGSANKDGNISFTATGTSASYYCVVVRGGSFVLDAGMIYAESSSTEGVIGAVQSNGGTFTMNENGAIHVRYTGNGSGKNSRMVHANGGTTIINGGAIRLESTKDAIGVVYSSGNVTFNGGKFHITASGTAAVTNKNTVQTNLNIRGGYYSATNNNFFTPHVKTPYHIFSIDEAPYTQRVAAAYDLSWTTDGDALTGDYTSGLTEAGTTITAPNTPTKTGYTFAGWSPEFTGTMPAANTEYTATWTVNTYTVTWKDADGTALRIDENVPYGTLPSYGSTPTKATDEEYVYTFAGWDITPVAVTADATYTATYNATPVVASVTISGNTEYYADFNTAWTAANSATAASTIKLLSDITATSILTYNNSNTQDCTLDLNGHTISSTQQAVLNPTKAGITFTMTDDSENHNGKLLSNATSTSTAYGVLVSAGTFVMENGTIEAHLKATTSKGVRVSGGASFTMNGGTIEVETTNSKDGDGVYTQAENATVTIHGGEIHVHAAATGYAVNVAGTTTITGGKFSASGSSSACIHKASGTLTLQGGYYSADTNLADNCATNYHVFPNDDATYIYKVAEGYTVTFNNYDGTALQTGLWEKNTTPVYSGDTPTKPEDERYTYEFAGWDAAIVPVVADATYMATFASTEKPQESIVVNEGETTTIDVNTETTTTIVHVSGTLEVAENVTLTTNDLILEATPSSSGEILGDVAVTQNAYFDLSQPGGFKAKTWYAIAVPWQVEVPAYALGDVSLSNDGENYTPQTLGTTFDLIYYDGARRATGVSKAWQYVEDDPAAEHVMVPGRAYMIYLTANTNVIRFRKSTSAALHTNELDVVKYPSSVDANYADWNGIANPATFKAFLNVGTTENLGQVYNAESKGYEWFHLNSNQLQVGQPIFVQPKAAKTVVAEREGGETEDLPLPPIGPAGMPLRRAKASVTTLARYEVAISSADDQVADRIIVRMDEDKETDAYTVGQDLAKMGLSTVVPQMWVNRYHTQLCVNTAFPTNNRADYPLALFAPAAGEYTIAITGDPTLVNNDAMLYLTYDGRTIWNLSYAPYSLSLESGTNTHYGLRIVYAPQVTTDLENGAADNVPCTKVLVDDHVFIIRGGRMYSIDGQWVK